MTIAALFPALNTEQLAELDALLERALDLDPGARSAWLDSLREQQSPLVAPLSRLLHTAVGSFLALPDATLGERDVESNQLPPGTRIGPWQIIEFAAAGGSADVYRGVRADGTFERQVAIKVLRTDSLRLGEHFAREQRLLAKLEHPRIASILDAGRSDGVGAWFVMPWIEGYDLAQFVAEGPDWHTRLAVFLAIADAVQFAHQRLVVHRDLKPANVRVGKDGTVMLLDFGIAMLLDTPDASQTPSRTHIAFTPAYASPEQLRGDALGVQTDIHALGLLLFELAAARAAYPEARVSLAEAVRVICHGAVPMLTWDARMPHPGRLQLRDLDAIVAKALAKDPSNRYATVAEFANDVRALVAGRSVSVRRRSVLDALLATVRRYPLVSALSLALLVAAGVGIYTYIKQNQQIAAERAEALAEVARLEALREHFNLILREGVAEQGMGARAALDESVARIDASFAGQPAMQARLLLSLGEIYLAAGDHAACLSVLSRFETVPDLLQHLTPRQQSERFLTQVTAALRLGQLDVATAALTEWAKLLPTGTSPALAAEHAIAKATLRRLQGEPGPALEAQTQAVAALDIAADATMLARGIAHANLGTSQLQAGQFAPARMQFERAIAIWESAGLGLNWNALTARTNLAHLALLQGDERTALAQYQDLEQRLRARGDRSAAFAALINGKARALLATGEIAAAAALADEALAILSARSGSQGLDRLGVLLSRIDIALANQEDPGTWLQDVRNQLAPLPPQHPFHARLALVEASLLQNAGRHQEASVALADVFPKLLSAPATIRPSAVRAAILWAMSARLIGEPETTADALNAAAEAIAAMQPETGLDRVELGLWQGCLQGHWDAAKASGYSLRAGRSNPRWLQLKQACASLGTPHATRASD